jgi:hypothetical protein
MSVLNWLNKRGAGQDNRVFTETRILAALIVPVLVVAFGMLYLFPHRTGELFAWPVGPPMTAMMLGAAYLGGAYFFSRVVLTQQWHTVTLGFIPVSFFAGYLGIATLLHWDAFTPGHISFILWVILYLTLPFGIAFAWFQNRVTDPHTPDDVYPAIPQAVRLALGIVGIVLTVASLFLLIAPDVMIPTWPWRLSPLTSRVMGAMFILPGLVGIGIWRDGRWSATRFILEAQVGSIILILLGVVLSYDDFNWSQFTAWTFTGGMTLLCTGLIALYFWMGRQRQR